MLRPPHAQWLLTVLVFLLGVRSNAQQGNTDIHTILRSQYWEYAVSERSDSNRILRKIRQGLQMQHQFPDSAFALFTLALQESRQISFSNGIASSLLQLGNSYTRKGMYDKSLVLFQQAIPYCTESEQGIVLLSSLYNNIALIYHIRGNSEQAARYYYKGTRIADNYNSSLTMGHIYNNLGMELNQLGRSEHALYYLEEAEKIARHKKHPELLSNVLVNKGVFYGNRKDWTRSDFYYTAALQMGQKNKRPQTEYIALTNLAFNFLRRDMPSGALPYLLKARALTGSIDPFYKNASDIILGEVYYRMDSFSLAESVLLHTLSQARELNLNKNQLETHEILADLYASTGRLRKAFDHQKLYMQLKDSLQSAETTRNINQLEVKYRTAQQEKKIAEKQLLITRQERGLEKRNLIIGGITTGAFVLLILLFVVYRTYRHRQKLQEKRICILQQEQEINQLKAIMQGEEKERTRIASDLHDGIVSQLLAVRLHFKATLQNRRNLPLQPEDFSETLQYLDDATRELRKTAHNLMPETVLQGGLVVALDSFCRKLADTSGPAIKLQSVGITCRLDPDIELSVYRIIQELVQNSLKHAAATRILVQLNWQHPLLSITVEDNGSGYDTHTPAGMGMTNVYMRTKALKGQIDLISEKGTGTAIYLEFTITPLKEIPPYANQSNHYG